MGLDLGRVPAETKGVCVLSGHYKPVWIQVLFGAMCVVGRNHTLFLLFVYLGHNYHRLLFSTHYFWCNL